MYPDAQDIVSLAKIELLKGIRFLSKRRAQSIRDKVAWKSCLVSDLL